MSYWSNQRLKEYKRILKLVETNGEEIIRLYEDMQDNIEKEIESYYARYAVDGKIELDSKLLDRKELERFKRDLSRKKEEIPEKTKWYKQLDKYGDRVRISRLESLNVQVTHEIEKMTIAQKGNMEDFLKTISNETYHRNMFIEMKSMGFKIDFDVISKRRLSKVFDIEWENSKLFESVDYNKDKLISAVQKEITQSAALGKTINEMSSSLSKEIGMSARSSRRLMRTASGVVSSEANLDYLRDTKTEKYTIDATLDDRTSDICQEMDQKTFDTKDYEVGVTAPPFHWNCRTTTIPNKADISLVRFARDKDGNRITVPGDWSYKDYKKEYLS